MLKNEASPEHPRCEECKAWKERQTPCVPGIRVGRFPIDVLFVGEAPGSLEDEWGAPFVGRAGAKVLRPLLKKLKVTNYIITNSVRCRPPNNKLNDPRGQRVIELCKMFLDEEISLLQPKKIVTLGKVALKSVTGKQENIKDIHGKQQEWTKASNKYNPVVIPTFHPAYVFRYPEAKGWIEDDLKLL